MSLHDKKKRQLLNLDPANESWNDDIKNTDDEGDATSSGGQSGQVTFHDFITRDNLLSAGEEQRLLAVHQDIHELQVKKQKETRELREDLKKEGKKHLQSYQAGLMGGAGGSPYKPNPKLADKAQFSGIDKQVISLPSENIAVTDEEKRDELQLQFQHQLQLRYTHDNTPRLTPK